MGLFSKLKDYNAELEEILDNKYFSASIKNLLFSMIYKIEISYNDFQKVKKSVRSKEDFLNEMIETIRLYCDNIKTVEPDSDQAKLLIKNSTLALTNEKERSILAYPTETAMLYAISDISPKYFFINEEFALKDILQRTLVNGYIANNMEILKDFNGWAWTKAKDEGFPYVDNLIYQNLLVILGEKFLYEWRTYGSTRKNFMQEIKSFMKVFTLNEDYLKSLYKVIYLNADDSYKSVIDESLKQKARTLKKMNDKITFIEDAKNQKMKIAKKLRKIDLILNDEKLLKKEFEKIKENNNIKTIAKYKKILMNSRKKCISEIENIDYILKPSNFLYEKKMIEDTISFYRSKEDLLEAIIIMQKEFLYFLDKKLGKMNSRDEIISILYEIRYYKSLQINENTYISDFEEIDVLLDKIIKKAITKLCKLGAMKIISMDINLNFEIIKYALDTQIVDLEETRIILKMDEEGLIIKVYDKDVFEKQGRKKIKVSNKLLEVKENRKIKLFN